MGRAAEGEVDVDEVLGQALQRSEVGQLCLGAGAEEQHQLAALELAALAQAAAPFRHGAHGSRAGTGADHHDVRLGVVRHQEGGAERPDDLHLVAHLQVAHVVAADATHRVALVVFEHALDGERQVVVARPLAVARAGDAVLARKVRLAALVGARRHDADGLALQHREGHGAEVQDDVVRVVFGAHVGDAHVAGDGGRHRLLGGARAVEVGVGVRGRPGRDGGAIAGGCRASAGLRRVDGGGLGLRLGLQGVVGLLIARQCVFGHAGFGQLRGRQLFGQLEPAELLFQRVGLGLGHQAPAVDGAGGAHRHAVHAHLAGVGTDHVVVRVVRDGVDGARRLARAAADADGGVDQVLLEDGGVGCGHGNSLKQPDAEDAKDSQRTQKIQEEVFGCFLCVLCVISASSASGFRQCQLKRTYSKSTGWRLMPITGGAIQLANLPGSTTRPIRLAT